jgi:guanine deaminase
MCFATIHWAKMRKMYFGCTRTDAAHIGFDDKFIYDVLKGKAKKKQVTAVQVARAECLKPFKEWEGKGDKKRY